MEETLSVETINNSIQYILDNIYKKPYPNKLFCPIKKSIIVKWIQQYPELSYLLDDYDFAPDKLW